MCERWCIRSCTACVLTHCSTCVLLLLAFLIRERPHAIDREESFVPRKEDDVESANEDTGHTWNGVKCDRQR